jgi:hypothetical protein
MSWANTLAYSGLFIHLSDEEEKKLCRVDTCGQFHKHFMHVTHGVTKISCTAHYMHPPMLFKTVQKVGQN